jgi:hypothetical protein
MHACKRILGVASAALALTSSFPSGSLALAPHDRSGFFAGFGLGVGRAAWTWGFESEDDPAEVSGTGRLHVGRALRDDLTVGLAMSAWVKDYDLESGGAGVGEATVSFALAAATVTWFPGNRGVFLRGGLGFATARGELAVDLPGRVSLALDATDLGVGALAAAGYEWRFTRLFAAGPQVELYYLGVAGDVADGVVVVDGAVAFHWYW